MLSFVAAALLVFLACPAMSLAGERPAITWLFAEGLAPYFEVRDGKPTGFIKDLQDFVEELVPEYEYRTEVVNIDRVLQQIEHGESYCFAAMAKVPRRQEIAAISTPLHFTQPHALLARVDDAAAMGGSDGGVNLEAMLSEERWLLGANLKRTYGTCLDGILARHSDGKGLYALSSTLPVENLMRMLLAGRLDAILEYPMSLLDAARRMNVRDRVAVLEIRECKELILGHVGCSKTPTGEAFVARLDEALACARGGDRHKSIFLPYVDEGRRESFERDWREFLRR